MIVQFEYPHRGGSFAVAVDTVSSLETIEFQEGDTLYEGTRIILDNGREYETNDDIAEVLAKLNGEFVPSDLPGISGL